MKKLFCILITVLLLCCSMSALAESIRFVEDSTSFDIELLLPEGAKVVSNTSSGSLSIVTIGIDGLAPVRVSIAPSELFEADSLNDMTEADITALGEVVGGQYDNPKILADETPSGNKYVHVCSNGESDVDAIVTLYKGYFIELTQWHDDYAALGEQDYAFLQQLLYSLEFIPLN